jgi:hypothetical protein
MKNTKVYCDCFGILQWSKPFSKILALGFYDGPTSGVAECNNCGDTYCFEMLTEKFGEVQDIRIFSLSLLPRESFNEIVDACLGTGEVQWPLWVPIWNFPVSDLKNKAEQQIKKALDIANDPSFVIAFNNISENILAVRSINKYHLDEVKDWYTFLGIGNT